jgi:hypothetical protein
MEKILLLTTLLVALFVSNGCQTSPSRITNTNANENALLSKSMEVDNSSSREEYDVYSGVINHERSLDGDLLITEKTTYGIAIPWSTLDKIGIALTKKFSASVSEEVLADFRSKNEESGALSNKFEIKNHYKLIGESNNSENNMGTLLSFSRVAFNKERDIALLYFDWHGGPKTGAGGFIVLKKKDGRWQKEAEFQVWIS